MKYKEVKTDSLLNRITNVDLLFNGFYTIDPYQNCEFGCKYCDSSQDDTVFIKTNAKEILFRELKQNKKGTIIIGSVHDPYQKAEKKYQITRNLLKTIKDFNFPVHILTKSDLVLRDIDILKKFSKCNVTISMISLDKIITNIFENNVPIPKTRLNTIEKLSNNGIKSGIAIIPIIPFITDDEIKKIIKKAVSSKASYVLHKHLELKGNQKFIFLDLLKNFNSGLIRKYEQLYSDSYVPSDDYIKNIDKMFNILCEKYKIKESI